jgi:hypothetical protein
MREVAIDSTDFQGRTSPRPWRLPTDTLECARCGSSLAGRREAVKRTTTRGICMVVETFRCRCGRGRRIERQEVAAS